MTAWVNENIGQPSAIKINESGIQWIDSTHQPFFLAVNYLKCANPIGFRSLCDGVFQQGKVQISGF